MVSGDVIAALFGYIGYLILLTIVHILTINSAGNTYTVLIGVFNIMLNLLYFFLVIGFVFMLIHLLKWLTWRATTPLWKREEEREERERG